MRGFRCESSVRELARAQALRGHLVGRIEVDVLDQVAVLRLSVADRRLERHRNLDEVEQVA